MKIYFHSGRTSYILLTNSTPWYAASPFFRFRVGSVCLLPNQLASFTSPRMGPLALAGSHDPGPLTHSVWPADCNTPQTSLESAALLKPGIERSPLECHDVHGWKRSFPVVDQVLWILTPFQIQGGFFKGKKDKVKNSKFDVKRKYIEQEKK